MENKKTDSFKLRLGKLEFGTKKIKLELLVDQTQPMFVTNDEHFKELTYKEEPSVVDGASKSHPLKSFYEGVSDVENDRFTFVTKVHSYINGNYVELWYDKKYQDILIVPDTNPIEHMLNGSCARLTCYRIGSGVEMSNVMTQPELTLPANDDKDRFLLPIPNENIEATVHLAAVPGLQSADFTQDANSYEEMLDDAINLKRYHRQMANYICLGTYNDIFKESDKSIPIYVLYQIAPRTFKYKYVGNTKPKDTAKIYVPLNF